MTKHYLLALWTLTALSACSDGSSSQNASAPTEVASTPPLPAVALGSSGQAAGIVFTITDVATPKQIGSVGVGPKAEAGETFLIVTYKLKNVSSRPLPPSARPTLTLIDPRGQTYAPDETASALAAVHAEDTGGFSADLNPNVSAKDCAAWKLDAKAFDRGTWRLSIATDPELTFALK